MKLTIITILFFVINLASYAQWDYNQPTKAKHFLYTSGEYIVSKNNSGNIGLNYVYNNKYSVNIGYSASSKSQIGMPLDFLKSGKDLTPTYQKKPFENFENFHIMFGRIVNLSSNNTIRLLLQGGPGIANYREPEFNLQDNAYDYTTKISKKMCFIVNPKIELPLTASLGLSAGPMLIVNSHKQYFGAGIGVMYGLIKN